MRPILLKGSAIIYTVMIMIVITALSLLLISYFNINTRLLTKITNSSIGNYYGHQGIAWLTDSSLYYNKMYQFSLDGKYEMTVQKKRWGAYDLHYGIVRVGNDTLFCKTAQMGYGKDTGDSTALILCNSNNSLHLADSVFINGYCYLPGGSVKLYTMSRSADFPKRVLPASTNLVSLQNAGSIFESLTPYFSQPRRGKIEMDDSVTNSFNNDIRVIEAGTIVVGGFISGNIVLNARKIIFTREASAHNIIALGETVEISEAFKGNMQVFASDSIVIGKNVKLQYPSVIVLSPKLKPQNKTRCIINALDSFSIQGEVYAYCNDVSACNMLLKTKSSVITGGLYSSTGLQWYGQCNGTVICNRFIDAQGIQENFLGDAIIDIDSLPSYYSYSRLFPTAKQNKVVQWVW